MARSTNPYPTLREVDILNVFWANRTPLTVRDVQDDLRRGRSPYRPAYTTLATMVRIMVRKKLLRLSDARRPQSFDVLVEPAEVAEQFTRYVNEHVLRR